MCSKQLFVTIFLNKKAVKQNLTAFFIEKLT